MSSDDAKMEKDCKYQPVSGLKEVMRPLPEYEITSMPSRRPVLSHSGSRSDSHKRFEAGEFLTVSREITVLKTRPAFGAKVRIAVTLVMTLLFDVVE